MAQHHEETDDAQVEANISPVIPRISGYVTQVRVKDNQQVKKGDTLLVLDDRDLKIKLQQAEAALATAQSNLGAAQCIFYCCQCQHCYFAGRRFNHRCAD